MPGIPKYKLTRNENKAGAWHGWDRGGGKNRVDGATGDVDRGAEYTPDQIEFMMAMDRYKRESRRPFPSWSEVLDVLKSLGYEKRSG